jgi:hypothetical protein
LGQGECVCPLRRHPTDRREVMPGCSDECLSCDSEDEAVECPKALHKCKHHCNCSWVHDECCWCGETFGEVPATPSGNVGK